MVRGYYYESDAYCYFKVPWKDMPPSRGNGRTIRNILDYTIWLRYLMCICNHRSRKRMTMETALSTSRDIEFDGSTEESHSHVMSTPRMVLEPPLCPISTPVSAYGLSLYVRPFIGNIVWYISVPCMP
ncbi:hypothetical protein K431DRAFT_65397 [Polychaeton citri CBS 116435]|uniref:Uncharacterized protein n=1 Tax=Polychaeton citri CBS 116435 TaxID=1314669 RepID=A0A9P4UMU6_9PEZI|nr:hypothetical protein K431DRAFT_65397 [Polychaeton citri CBS 116435]